MANMDIVNRVIKKLTSDELLNLRDYWRMEDKLNYNNGYMKGYNAAKKKYKKQFNSEPNNSQGLHREKTVNDMSAPSSCSCLHNLGNEVKESAKLLPDTHLTKEKVKQEMDKDYEK